ncbi:MAG: hypothetical protein EOP56_07235 [Sphingobacteriales bacterium]|nr:MAG: hypothetical protein EOP56_07235 [Sphingobacteriales bacterium]
MILDTTEIIVTYLDTVEVIDTTIYTDSAYTVARDSSYEIMTVLERQRFVDNKHYYQVNNTNATTGDLPLSLSTLPIPATVCWLYGTMAASSATSSLPTR